MNNGLLVLIITSLISIPIGIITSLLTPLVLRAFQNINQKSRTKSKYIAQKEYEMITLLHSNKQELSMFFINIIIKAAFIIAIISIISFIFLSLPQIVFQTVIYARDSFNIDTRIFLLMTAIGQFIIFIGYILIVNMCRTAYNVWKKVKNYDNYSRILKEKKII
jgi:hypothetical protein